MTSIRTEGLRDYLERTRELHNGRGYVDFVHYLTDGDEFGDEVSKPKLARAFKVNKNTVYKWIGIYREEQAHVSEAQRPS